jgi:hypothetical protein
MTPVRLLALLLVASVLLIGWSLSDRWDNSGVRWYGRIAHRSYFCHQVQAHSPSDTAVVAIISSAPQLGDPVR